MFFVYVTFAGFSRFLTSHWTVRLIRGERGFIFFVVFVNGGKAFLFYRLVLLRFLNILLLKYVSALVNCWRRVPQQGRRNIFYFGGAKFKKSLS